jgi:hypothetical protein
VSRKVPKSIHTPNEVEASIGKRKFIDGSKTYKLHIPAKPPVNNFWAVTVDDPQMRSMLQTSEAFPTVGSQT